MRSGIDGSEQDLRDACFEVARTTMWDLRPVDMAAIEAHGERLLEVAKQQVKIVKDFEADTAIVTHCVKYLGQCHALPPMRDNISWFEEALDVLVTLCCPNTIGTEEIEPFLAHLETGIARLRGEQ